jgi:hypothetical protein
MGDDRDVARFYEVSSIEFRNCSDSVGYIFIFHSIQESYPYQRTVT